VPAALWVFSAIATLCVACSHAESVNAGFRGGVLFTRGLSTDPYGTSHLSGFGVVLGIGGPEQRAIEAKDRNLGWFGGVQWLGNDGRILVPRRAPPLRRPVLYRLEDESLQRVGEVAPPAREPGAVWSADGRLIAGQPIEPCRRRQRTLWKCYRGSGRVVVRHGDGTHPRVVARGRFVNVDSWTPDGFLLVTAGHTYAALDVRTGRRTIPLSPRRIAALFGLESVWVSPPRWSADGRYVAAKLGASHWRKAGRVYGALVLAHADGRPIRVVTSPYLISMFAWSPVGHRLAFTTSGFPAPHQLLVVDTPTAKPRPLFVTARHFDWITWSPDGRRLLLDDEHANHWRLISSSRRRVLRSLPRFGGRPLWCCPVNAFATQ
jgi:hypothetical protein